MTCKNCGKEIVDTGRFCKYCGTLIDIQIISEENTAENTPETVPEPSVTSRCNPSDDITDSQTAVSDSGNVKSSAYRSLFIISSIVAVLAIICGILAYTSATNTAKTEIRKLQDTIDNQDSVIDDYYEQTRTLRADVESYKTSSEYYQDIVDFINSNKSTNSSKNYYADTNVYFVEKGRTITVNLHVSYGGTIRYDAGYKNNISCDWGDWVNTSAHIKFTGKSEGSQLVHFTKDGATDNFYILVVCVP